MKYNIKDILRMEVAPALGCTEPVAAALGAAAAASILPNKEINSIEVWADSNIYKNGIAVGIPGARGLKGLDIASAIGALGGNPSLKLEVLNSINDEIVERAKNLVCAGKVKINHLREKKKLYLKTVIRSGTHMAESIICDLHSNITSLVLDGQVIVDSPLISNKKEKGRNGFGEFEDWLKGLSLKEILRVVNDLDQEDEEFLKKGISYNMHLAEYGLKHGPGLGVGKTLDRLARQKLIKRDMILAARILTSAASDARMSGVDLPAMSSAGSGNHGLVAVLPILAVKDFIECEEENILKAIGLSHIVTAYIKAYTGRLSVLCGSSIVAGAGAAAGVAYLLGGNQQHIEGAIIHFAEDMAGIICDGAKPSCALKLATAAGNAVQAALISLQKGNVKPEGIAGATFEETAQNIGLLSTGCSDGVNRVLFDILDKNADHSDVAVCQTLN